MKTSFKDITPKFAGDILAKHNGKNRKISERIVDKYANDMKVGAWGITHQGIAFDTEGDLLDGQHRLAAIIKSGKTIKMLVTTGLDKSFKNNGGHSIEMFGMIDGSRPRTASTYAQIMGMKESSKVSGIVRMLLELCASSGGAIYSTSAPMLREVVKITNGSIEAVIHAAINRPEGSIIQVRLTAAMLTPIVFLHTTEPEKAIKFLHECQTLETDRGSSPRALANWKQRHIVAGGANQIDAVWIAAAALWHWYFDRKITRVAGSRLAIDWMLNTNPPMVKAIAGLRSSFSKLPLPLPPPTKP
jgi:hypothetical protein